nr:MAG TPA: hypothetical protein [Caudoviricetes sp.]
MSSVALGFSLPFVDCILPSLRSNSNTITTQRYTQYIVCL